MPRQKDSTVEIKSLRRLGRAELWALWTKEFNESPPACLGRDVLALGIAYAMQERRYGGLSRAVTKELKRVLALALQDATPKQGAGVNRPGTTLPRTGTVLVREWQGATHHGTVVQDGFLWKGQTHRSLSAVAHAITGAKWNGPRFFGMRETVDNMVVRHGSH
jgi:Protein of unknown function (DUF2924)